MVPRKSYPTESRRDDGKWDEITTNFVTKLPRTSRGHESIWIMVDRLTKSAQFIPIKEKFSVNRLVDVCIKEVVKFHGVLVSIVSDRDSLFTSHFWQSFQKHMGSKILMSTPYHPRTDGKS